MQHSIKKRAINLLLLAMASTIVIFCAGCNNSTPTQATNNKPGIQNDNFNEENAKQESRSELEKFLALSANKTVIANDNEMEKIRAFVDNKCKAYFTNDFINDTTNALSTKGFGNTYTCLLYTSDAADEEDSVDLGGRRIIKKKKKKITI